MRKLSPSEISRIVGKIRKKYDEYSYKYFKSARHKTNFEKRYVDALKSGVDISTFLLAEISAVEELLKREEEKVMARPQVKSAPAGGAVVDRILEENKRRIEKYPDLSIHPDARDELRRLFGALHKLEEEYWPTLFTLLRHASYIQEAKSLIGLESRLHVLGGNTHNGVPARLERYLAHLNRFPRDYALLEKEEKDYILEAAFFLHELDDLLASIREKNMPAMQDDERNRFMDIKAYIEGVIADFRLKELKKKERGVTS